MICEKMCNQTKWFHTIYFYNNASCTSRSLKQTEQEAAYKHNFDTPKYLVMYNEEETNHYGDHKGYRILPEQMSKMLLPEDYRGAKARAWTSYQVEYPICLSFS